MSYNVIKLFDKKTASLITTNNTPVVAIEYDLPTKCVLQVWARVSCIKMSGDYGAATWVYANSFRRDTGASALYIGGPSPPDQSIDHRDDTSVSSASTYTGVSGSKVQIVVAGPTAAGNVSWYCYVDYLLFRMPA